MHRVGTLAMLAAALSPLIGSAAAGEDESSPGRSAGDPFLGRFIGRWIGDATFDGETSPIEFRFTWALQGEFLEGTLWIFEDSQRTRIAYEGREYKRPAGPAGEYRIAYFGSAGEQETIEGRASGNSLHCESLYTDGRRETGSYDFEGEDRLTYSSRIVDPEGKPVGTILLKLARAEEEIGAFSC